MSKTDETGFQRLLHLLTKLEASKRHAKVSVDWDGSRFRWNVTIGGLGADEFHPAQHLAPHAMRSEEL